MSRPDSSHSTLSGWRLLPGTPLESAKLKTCLKAGFLAGTMLYARYPGESIILTLDLNVGTLRDRIEKSYSHSVFGNVYYSRRYNLPASEGIKPSELGPTVTGYPAIAPGTLVTLRHNDYLIAIWANFFNHGKLAQ